MQDRQAKFAFENAWEVPGEPDQFTEERMRTIGGGHAGGWALALSLNR